MAKFNYNIYYKDAQTGQDLASPVRVGYDSFDTLISETQKNFNGYTARELWESQKRTPSESSYNNSPSVIAYNSQYSTYLAKRRIYERRQEETRNLLSNRNLKRTYGMMVLEDYNFGRSGSLSYYDDMKIYTLNSGVSTLARPITYGGNPEYNDKYSGIYRGKSYLLEWVSRTTDYDVVNAVIRINNYYETGHGTPGLWIARPEGGTGIGIWMYNIYQIDFSIHFVTPGNRALTLPISTAVTDIDYRQYIKADFNASGTIYSIPPGSGIGYNSGYVGDNSYMKIDDPGIYDIPRGSFVMSGVGSRIDFSATANVPGISEIKDAEGKSSSWTISLFGNSSRGEIIDLSKPVPPTPPTGTTNDITILYDKVAKLRPWAIRNSGQWVSFTTKQIDMIIRKRGKQDTSINAEDAGKLYGSTSTGVYLPPYSASGNVIRKDGTWKQQGKIGR